MPVIEDTASQAFAQQQQLQPSPLTCGAALAIVAAWRDVVASWGQRWPMADEYAIEAFGGAGGAGELDDSYARRDARYPQLAENLLMQDVARFVSQRPDSKIKLSIVDRWDDLKWRDDLLSRENIGGVKVQFKIPVPMCKGGKLPHRNADGKWVCDVATIDDPITAVVTPAMVVGALVIAALFWTKKGK